MSGLLLQDLRLFRAGHVNGPRHVWMVLAEAIHEPVVASLQVQLQALRGVRFMGNV